MRFADYFGRAFASVSAAQFPWLKTFKEFSVAKLFDVSFFCNFKFFSFGLCGGGKVESMDLLA